MTVRSVLLVSLVLAASAFAGCVENMQDLKDRVDGASDEPIEGASTPGTGAGGQSSLPPATVAPVVPKPPVARISIFGDGGAQVFKAGFAADETLVPTVFAGGVTLTLSAADSEAVDAKATLAEYAWSVAPLGGATAASGASGGDHSAHAGHFLLAPASDDGGHDHGSGAAAAGHDMTGVSVQHTFPEDGGVFLVTLTVKDSLGASDMQALKVGVMPAPVTKSVRFQGTVQAGSAGQGTGEPVAFDRSEHVFNVSATVGELPAKAIKALLTLAAKDARGQDLDLVVNDPTGAEAAAADGTSSATLELADLAVGDWKAVVLGQVAVLADYELLVDVTYQPSHPDVEKLFGPQEAGGDGHGDHAH